MRYRNLGVAFFALLMVGSMMLLSQQPAQTQASSIPPQYPECSVTGTHAACLTALRIPCIAKDANACHLYSLEIRKDCPTIPQFVMPNSPGYQEYLAAVNQYTSCNPKVFCWEQRSQQIPILNNSCKVQDSDACRLARANFQQVSASACDAFGQIHFGSVGGVPLTGLPNHQ